MRNPFRIIMILVVCGVTACNEPPVPQAAKSQALDAALGAGDIGSEAEVVPPQSQVVVSREAVAFINALKADDRAIIRAYFPANYPAAELVPDTPDRLFIRDRLRPLIAKGAMDAKEVSREGMSSQFCSIERHSPAVLMTRPISKAII